MELNRFIEDENEKHYFGYSSTEVFHSLIITLQKCIKCFMDALRNTLLDQKIEFEIIESEVQKLQTVYIRESMKVLEKFKIKIQEMFRIPPNAPIYGKVDDMTRFNDEDIATLRKEVEELEKTYFREKLILKSLQLEKEIIEKVKTMEKKLLSNYKKEEPNEILESFLQKHARFIENITSEVSESEILN